ncbi:AsmA-like C-terminal region-containing protein, partial [Rickettsiales bacterium]|nr:AsmA-like C-terminal region-containing protein [Rickettsiales bacterium]
LDLSNAILSELFKREAIENQSSNINIDAKNILMKNGEYFSDFKGEIDCPKIKCNKINIYSTVSENNFLAISLSPLEDRSSFLMESDNAGSILRALGISNNVNNGRLTLQAISKRYENNNLFAEGTLRLDEFKAIKTPILGKLLTLASLKGITDILNQEGISFKKFEAPFNMSDNIINIKNAKSSGSSIGITGEGTIDMNNGHMDISGVVIPAHEVNKALSNIPIVGKLIVGKKNEGVIATKYRIKGPYEDAKVTVNPLSILTPGFLRNLFDIFD